MKRAIYSAFILSLLAFSLIVFVRCSAEPSNVASAPTEVAAPAEPAGVKLVSVEETRVALENGAAIVVDVRNAQQYEASHIAGSIHVPFAQVATRAAELPKGKLVVLYCTCPAEESSAGAAQILASVGVTNTAALRGGLQAWSDAGLPVQTGS